MISNTITNIKIDKSLCDDCDEAVIRLIREGEVMNKAELRLRLRELRVYRKAMAEAVPVITPRDKPVVPPLEIPVVPQEPLQVPPVPGSPADLY